MNRRYALRQVIACVMIMATVITMLPETVYAAAVTQKATAYTVTAEGRDASGNLNGTSYTMDSSNVIRIPLSEAGYNSNNRGNFDGFRLVSNPSAVMDDDYFAVTGDGFGTGNDGIFIDGKGHGVLYASSSVYANMEQQIKATGEYKLDVKFGKTLFKPGVGETVNPNNIYKEFSIVFTGQKESTTVPNNDVTFVNGRGQSTVVTNGDDLSIYSTDTGSFTIGNYSNEKEEIEWSTSWSGATQDKPIWIAKYTGALVIRNSGTVTATAVRAKDGVELCRFTIQANKPEFSEIQLFVDGQDVTGGNYTVEGHEWKEIQIKGKVKGQQEFIDVASTQDISFASDNDIISSDNTTFFGFIFMTPGTGTITVSAYGATASFRATSTYVPIQSINLNLQDTVSMHRLVYSMGKGDNYMGLPQADLLAGLTVEPANASYYTVNWRSSDSLVAEYFSTHSNGFIGHKEGTVDITASINDNGTVKEATDTVNFVFESKITNLTLGNTALTVKADEEIDLPLVFSPSQPSQTAINWKVTGDGDISIRQVRGEYDNYASKVFKIAGIAEGNVEVIGTPVCAEAGVAPITFTVTVTPGTNTTVDTTKLVTDGVKAAKFHYQYYWTHKTWGYGDEWDVLALKRSGNTVTAYGSSNEATNIATYLADIKSKIDDGTLDYDSKPTDIARVALAITALGEDPSCFNGFDFRRALYDNEKLKDGSNEVIWALIALDAKQETIPADALFTREKMIEMILSYQAKDGGFGLSDATTSSIDMTAMALQALASYKNDSKVMAAIDAAVAYLKANMDNGCDFNGTSESLAQVILTMSTLGVDVSLRENGFAVGSGKNLFTGLEKYKHRTIGYKHFQADTKENHMSTQQALLGMASWQRLQNGQTAIYDMSDVAYKQIQVSFRLIGDLNHGKDGEHAGYINWIKTKTVEVKQNATVYDVFEKVLAEAKMTAVGASNNYVSTIYAPEVLGGYALSERGNGKKSGWMYLVNGVYPSVGLQDCTLADGDSIVWRYIDDFETKDDFDELMKNVSDDEPEVVAAGIIKDMEDTIAALPEAAVVTEADRDVFNSVKSKLDALPQILREQVSNKEKLQAIAEKLESLKPTATPTVKPTTVPTVKPTVKPTTAPTVKPTVKPTTAPTVKPTVKPTTTPTTTPAAKTQKLTVSKSSYKNTLGDKDFALNAKTDGKNCKLTYATSNKKVAVVSAKGIVSIKGTGKATITITSKGTGYKTVTKKVTITVKPKTLNKPAKESVGKNSIKISWKKDSNASGYKIEYSTSKKFTKKTTKSITISKNSTKTKTIKSLKKNKKYYVRVRSYKKSGKTMIYGNWSKATSITTKK